MPVTLRSPTPSKHLFDCHWDSRHPAWVLGDKGHGSPESWRDWILRGPRSWNKVKEGSACVLVTCPPGAGGPEGGAGTLLPWCLKKLEPSGLGSHCQDHWEHLLVSPLRSEKLSFRTERP